MTSWGQGREGALRTRSAGFPASRSLKEVSGFSHALYDSAETLLETPLFSALGKNSHSEMSLKSGSLQKREGWQ